MRSRFPLLFAAVLFVLLLTRQTAAHPGSDQAFIREIVQKYMDARDHQDAQALEALFSADADQLVSAGEWRRGRDAVVRGTLASSRDTGGRRTITIESVRFLSKDVAVADGRYELTGLAGGESRKMWTTLLVARTPDGWRITAIRNMLPAPPAPTK